MDHSGIVDGQDLNTYIICQFIVISQIGFMLLDVFFVARKIVYALLRREYIPFQAFAEPCSDLFCTVFISVYMPSVFKAAQVRLAMYPIFWAN